MAGRYLPDMQALMFDTPHLRVGPWQAGDAAWYLEAVADADIERWTREVPSGTVEAWTKRLRTVQMSPTRSWSCIATLDGTRVGSLRASLHGGVVELSYWIARDARGRGYAREALEGAVSWWSDHQAVERFHLEIHPDNRASVRVAERVGFRFEGFEQSCDTCADDLGRVAIYTRPAAMRDHAR